MKYNYLLILLVSVVMVAEGKQYCYTDDECTELGDLLCIKSKCNLGVCGCPRGEAAIFSGSKDKYICVTVKRVGESCATDGDGDICGAPGSACKDGKCECSSPNHVPRLGGETCGSPDDRYAGETCNAIRGCADGSECESPDSGNNWYNPVEFDVPTCACPNSHKLVIANSYTNPFDSTIPFVGSSYPTCVKRKIGDRCVHDDDCPDNKCEDSKCVCSDAAKKPDYDKTNCYTPQNIGDVCSPTHLTERCDGTKGLICEDQCSLNPTSTCTCGPWHTLSGSTCTPIVEEGACYGDYNCKGFSATGACVDRKCRNGGLQLASSVTGLLALLAFALQHNLMF